MRLLWYRRPFSYSYSRTLDDKEVRSEISLSNSVLSSWGSGQRSMDVGRVNRRKGRSYAEPVNLDMTGRVLRSARDVSGRCLRVGHSIRHWLSSWLLTRRPWGFGIVGHSGLQFKKESERGKARPSSPGYSETYSVSLVPLEECDSSRFERFDFNGSTPGRLDFLS